MQSESATRGFDRDRLLELAGSYCDGVASEAEVAWLEQTLAGDGDARLAFVKYAFVHGHARFAAAARAQRLSVATIFPEIAIVDSRRPPRAARWRWVAVILLAVAVAVAVVGADGRIGGLRSPFATASREEAAEPVAAPAPAAALATVTQPRFLILGADADPISVGDRLDVGRLSLPAGVVDRLLRNGVTIVPRGPREHDLIDRMNAFLYVGNSVVRVLTYVLDLHADFAGRVVDRFVTEGQVYDGSVTAMGQDSEPGGGVFGRLDAG